MCLIICLEKLGLSSFFFAMYYLTKHSSFKQKIIQDFSRYAKEIYQIVENYLQIENFEFVNKNFAETYAIDKPFLFGNMLYYRISDVIKPDKETALINFKKAHKLAKEKEYNFKMRLNYLYVYKCRKHLFKNNQITLRKLNKTKQKLFLIYEETNKEYGCNRAL